MGLLGSDEGDDSEFMMGLPFDHGAARNRRMTTPKMSNAASIAVQSKAQLYRERNYYQNMISN